MSASIIKLFKQKPVNLKIPVRAALTSLIEVIIKTLQTYSFLWVFRLIDLLTSKFARPEIHNPNFLG